MCDLPKHSSAPMKVISIICQTFGLKKQSCEIGQSRQVRDGVRMIKEDNDNANGEAKRRIINIILTADVVLMQNEHKNSTT